MGLFYGENINYNLVYYFSNITVIRIYQYIEDKIGKSISIMSYQRYKNRAIKDTKYTSTSKWVSYQAKIGHIESYRKRLDEMELINQETLKLWYMEIKKEEKDQDKDFIIALIQLLQE